MGTENGLVKVGIIARSQKAVKCLKQDLRTTNLATSVFETVRELASNREETRRLIQTQPEVLLIDLGAPSGTIETLNFLRRSLPESWPLIISEEANTQLVIDVVRAGAREFLSHPVSAENLLQSLRRYTEETRNHNHTPEGTLYCVNGPKGGVGSTTVAINLAAAKAAESATTVSLIDLTLPLGDIATYLDLKPEYSFADVLAAGERLDPVLLKTYMTYSNKVAVLPGPGEFSLYNAVEIKTVDKTLKVARQAFTHTVVDLPSCCDENILRVCAEASDSFIIVLTPEVPALWRAHRLLLFLSRICGPEGLKVVLNRTHKKDRITSKDVEKTLSHPVFWSLPNDYQTAITSINSGRPLVTLNKTHLASSYSGMERKLAGHDTEPSKRGLLGIFG
jgi:pilus assembly protein CpaE